MRNEIHVPVSRLHVCGSCVVKRSMTFDQKPKSHVSLQSSLVQIILLGDDGTSICKHEPYLLNKIVANAHFVTFMM